MSLDLNLLDQPEGKDGRVMYRSISIIIFIFLCFLCLLVGFYVSLIEIETIIASGGAMIALSLTLLILAIAQRKYYLVIQVVAGLAIVGVIFLYIFLKNLPPAAARKPVPTMILILTAVYLVPLGFSLIKEFNLKRREKR